MIQIDLVKHHLKEIRFCYQQVIKDIQYKQAYQNDNSFIPNYVNRTKHSINKYLELLNYIYYPILTDILNKI